MNSRFANCCQDALSFSAGNGPSLYGSGRISVRRGEICFHSDKSCAARHRISIPAFLRSTRFQYMTVCQAPSMSDYTFRVRDTQSRMQPSVHRTFCDTVPVLFPFFFFFIIG